MKISFHTKWIWYKRIQFILHYILQDGFGEEIAACYIMFHCRQHAFYSVYSELRCIKYSYIKEYGIYAYRVPP